MVTEPAASRDALPGLAVIGLDHRTASPALRDVLFIAEPDLPAFHDALRRAGIVQAVVLSTCDRLEVQLSDHDPEAASARVAQIIAQRAMAGGIGDPEAMRIRLGARAIGHIFRVAASLESHVAGESQILGQIKEADRRARACGMMGPELDGVLQAAYAAAKRVRNETTIGERPTSMAAAAVGLARDVHGDLARVRALVIGTGELGEVMIEHLRGAGLRDAVQTDPNPARAADQGRRLSLATADFGLLADLLAEADIVIAAVGLGRILIDRSAIDRASQRRRRRPVLVLDFAVPNDVDTGIESVDGVFRYDTEDLERLAMQGRVGREREIAAAANIVEFEVARFVAARASRAAVPAIATLRRRFEAERARALADFGGDAARATELMMSRLLHQPQEKLRALAASDADASTRAAAERMVRMLFGVDEGGEGP